MYSILFSRFHTSIVAVPQNPKLKSEVDRQSVKMGFFLWVSMRDGTLIAIKYNELK